MTYLPVLIHSSGLPYRSSIRRCIFHDHTAVAIETLIDTRCNLRVWRDFPCTNSHIDDTAGASGNLEGLQRVESREECGEGGRHFGSRTDYEQGIVQNKLESSPVHYRGFNHFYLRVRVAGCRSYQVDAVRKLVASNIIRLEVNENSSKKCTAIYLSIFNPIFSAIR